MGWRRGELWLDADVGWFREGAGSPAVAGVPPASTGGFLQPQGLHASRLRRSAWERRRDARRARAAAIAVSPAVMFALAGIRSDKGADNDFLLEDPPSLTFTLDTATPDIERVAPRALPDVTAKHVRRKVVSRAHALPTIAWHHATSVGLPYGGRLVDGTQLPLDGPGWVTWNPITDSVPNLPDRLYGNELTIRKIVAVTDAYRAAHPHAARVVVGDISRTDGGPMDDHVSHQNGLDVDIYLPRVDRKLRAPHTPEEIDRSLSQDLLDRFVAAGAQMIFVAPSRILHGPARVVIPYPGHEYHMHVRFRPPRG
jgi:Penicillin-insensitive murein endopeptidase